MWGVFFITHRLVMNSSPPLRFGPAIPQKTMKVMIQRRKTRSSKQRESTNMTVPPVVSFFSWNKRCRISFWSPKTTRLMSWRASWFARVWGSVPILDEGCYFSTCFQLFLRHVVVAPLKFKERMKVMLPPTTKKTIGKCTTGFKHCTPVCKQSDQRHIIWGCVALLDIGDLPWPWLAMIVYRNWRHHYGFTSHNGHLRTVGQLNSSTLRNLRSISCLYIYIDIICEPQVFISEISTIINC